MQDFENIDETVPTTTGVSDEDILNAVRATWTWSRACQSQPNSSTGALEAAKVLYKIFTHHEDDPVATEDVLRLQEVSEAISWEGEKRWTTLKDFFQTN